MNTLLLTEYVSPQGQRIRFARVSSKHVCVVIQAKNFLATQGIPLLLHEALEYIEERGWRPSTDYIDFCTRHRFAFDPDTLLMRKLDGYTCITEPLNMDQANEYLRRSNL